MLFVSITVTVIMTVTVSVTVRGSRSGYPREKVVYLPHEEGELRGLHPNVFLSSQATYFGDDLLSPVITTVYDAKDCIIWSMHETKYGHY